MYFHSVHGKNIQLSADNSQARRISGFCQGITFSNNPLTPLQRVTFVVASDIQQPLCDSKSSNGSACRPTWKKSSSSSMWRGNLRIGVTTKNPTTLISSELPEFSYPTLLNADGYWITCIKSSYLRSGNKISLVLDKNNSLQLAINYVVKATLFGNDMIPNTPQTKLWLILDLFGATSFVQFLPSDETPYEIKERGLDAINNFHSACLSGGSKSIYKTRLVILGQDEVGKMNLKNSLVNLKEKTTSSKKKPHDLSASFRVKIDGKSNWHLKAILNNEWSKKYHKLNRNLSQSSNSLDVMNKSNLFITKNTDLSASYGSDKATSLSKRKSSSTSYLNEEDDYDDDYSNSLGVSMNMKQFRKAQKMSKAQEVAQIKPPLDNNEDTNRPVPNNDPANSVNDSSSSSSSSSCENSDGDDDDVDPDLYAIDEYDEVFPNFDHDSHDLKKDPSGVIYKKIAMNIYRELFATKLWDKLWPKTTNEPSNPTATTSAEIKLDDLNLNNSGITETIFEKIALMEFEASIYNQLSCSKLPSRTILVSPVEKREPTLSGGNDFFSNWAENSENLKLMSKKLSLTICDLADQSHQLLLSSRAVYVVCFDLGKNLDDLSDTNFDLGPKKNEEMTNLDYLDFMFKSIHYSTAKLTNITTTAGNTIPSLVKVKSEDDEKANSHSKVGLMSPPILLVGTNRNSLPGANRAELIKKKFDRVKEFVSSKIYAGHILEPYFAMENTNPTDTNDSAPQRRPDSLVSNDLDILKRRIQIAALSEPYMGEQLPIKWMNFDKSLEKLKNKGLFYASLSQICEIAHEKDIKTQEELTTCLNFLNDLGQIIYYGNAQDIFLRNTIILRPQKLIEIFNMVLNAQTPTWLDTAKMTTSGSNNQTNEWLDLWQKFDQRGILHDRLLDVIWKNVINQKPGLLGLMKKFDLICERSLVSNANTGAKFGGDHLNREYLVPSRAKIGYDEEEAVAELVKDSENELDDDDDNDSENSDYFESPRRARDQDDNKSSVSSRKNRGKKSRTWNNGLNVEFYYDFCGFLPESLFHRIITRAARWTLMKPGANPITSVSMYYRKARFYLDDNHYFTIEMLPLIYARIKIEIVRLNLGTNGSTWDPYPPDPNACAKVRNFMETSLIDLRNLWMKRLTFYACVQCSCEKLCDLHQIKICNDHRCMHFLNLDECLTNNIVTCDYRRVKTLVYKSWFPTQNISLHKGPVLSAFKTYSDKNMFYEESSLPNWIKNVAKLLQTYGKEKENKEAQIVTVQNENDWLALARLLGYSKSKISYFNESDNPALQLICDWIMSSDNTNLTIEFLLNYLEQIKREDVIKIINNEREKETVNSSIFISYNWDSQEIVIKIKEHLEKAGFHCFMDVGQIGGGNLLYQKIDQAIRNAKVVIACITPKFVVSHYCNREMALADLLHKPIVPIMLTATPWPPPGGMGLIFSQLVYVDYFGVGGHGGCGINADRDQRNNEIVAMCSRHINPSSYFLMNIDRLTDNNDKSLNGQTGAEGNRQKRNFLEQLKPSQLIRSSQYYNDSNVGANSNRRASMGNNNSNNNNGRRRQTHNQFLNEVNFRGANFLIQHQSHLINQQMAAQNHNSQRSAGRGRNLSINLNRGDVGGQEATRCAVCVIL